MAIPIEGYTVVAKKSRIGRLIDDGSIEVPNATALADDHIWRCSFMAETDAIRFIESLKELGLEGSQGPDSDIVLVNEFDCSVAPYCEWLKTGRWEKAIIAWKVGTQPKSVVAREGWDPKVGSGFTFQRTDSMDNLEFLRLEGNVEVYLNKQTNQEVFIGRTTSPTKAMYEMASRTISKNFVTAGQEPVTGQVADDISEAVKQLEQVIEKFPDSWKAHWYLGKGQLALGKLELAYHSLRRSFDLQKEVEIVPRELAGVCLATGRFEEAVTVAEHAASIKPDSGELIGNLALAYLLAGRIEAAQKSIKAATSLAPDDRINRNLKQLIHDVIVGKRPQPDSLASLSKPSKSN